MGFLEVSLDDSWKVVSDISVLGTNGRHLLIRCLFSDKQS